MTAPAPTEPDATPAPEAKPPDLVSLIPEDLRDNPALAPHFSPEGAFDLPGALKSYISAQSLIGGDRIPVPKSDAPQEQWDQFFNRLGRPEAPDGYELQVPKDYPLEADEKLVADFRERAHAAGLSASQTQALFEWFLNRQSGDLQTFESNIKAMREKSTETLRREYGDAFDSKLEAGRRIMQHFGDDELSELLKTPEIGNHPALVRFAIRLSEELSEDTLAPGIRGPARFGLTPDAARAEIDSLMADEAYLNPNDPRHDEIVRKIGELTEAAWRPDGSSR